MQFNDFQEKKIGELIHYYNTGPRQPMELEVRFPRPDSDTFYRVIEDFTKANPKATVSVAQMLSVMTDSTKGSHGWYFDRKELFYKDGIQENTAHNRKLREQMFKVFAGKDAELFRISLASEEEIAEFSSNQAHRFRFRLRYSVLLDKDWRYDFTVAIQLEKSQMSELKSTKAKVFPNKKITPSNFIEHVKTLGDFRPTYEFEIEHIGDKASLQTNGVDKIRFAVSDLTKIINPGFEEASNYQNTIHEIASKLIKDKRLLSMFQTKFGLKKLANQPHNLTKATFDTIVDNIEDYYASDKADGERCFVQVFPKTGHVFIVLTDRVHDMTTFFSKEGKGKSSGKSKGKSGESTPTGPMTVFDAEIINLDREDPSKSKHPAIYLFDIVLEDDKQVSKHPFEKRQALLDPYCSKTSSFAFEKKILVRLEKDKFGDQLETLMKRKTRAYDTDGWVLTPAKAQGDHAKYNEANDYFDMTVYKLKPIEKMTIDFLILEPPKNMLGHAPYVTKPGQTLYCLFSGVSMHDSRVLNLEDLSGYEEMTKGIPTGNYFPVQFSTSEYPYAYLFWDKRDDLHQQVGEFHATIDDKKEPAVQWKLENMRPDKTALAKAGTSFGNSFRVAEEVFLNYLNPITLDYIKRVQKEGADAKQQYFLTAKLEEYKPLTKRNNYVKAQLLRQLEGKPWVVDLAAGKGQDLFTYNGFEVKSALFVDIDQAALEELARRKWDLGNTRSYIFSRAPRTNIRIFTMQADLSKPAKQHIAAIENRGFPLPRDGDQFLCDGVVINLAIHYMAASNSTLDNIVGLASTMLKKHGVFVVTTFDGKRVFDLLEKTKKGASWDLGASADNKSPPKYSIKKKYDDKKFKTGLQIGVIHPFSRGQYYDEYLVDIDELIAIAKKHGLKMQQRGSFADYDKKFEKFNPKFGKAMSADDKKYGALYGYISFYKE